MKGKYKAFERQKVRVQKITSIRRALMNGYSDDVQRMLDRLLKEERSIEHFMREEIREADGAKLETLTNKMDDLLQRMSVMELEVGHLSRKAEADRMAAMMRHKVSCMYGTGGI